MGGRDKGLLPLFDRPLAAHVRDAVVGQVATVLINANRHLDRYAALGCELCPDRRPAQPGPLAGVEAGLQATATPWMLSVPCDAVRLPTDLVARLLAAAQLHRTPAAYAALSGRGHYPLCLWRVSLRSAVAAALDHEQRAVGALLRSVGAVAVSFDDADPPPVFSLNDAADWQAQGWTAP